MKKISSILVAMVVFFSTGYGQAKQVNSKTEKKQVTSAKVAAKPVTNAVNAKKTTALPQAKQAAQAPLTKKDGTPDKRFKANKVAKLSPDVVLKKDGTPDKRYKAVAKKP